LRTGPPSWESISGLLEGSTNTGSGWETNPGLLKWSTNTGSVIKLAKVVFCLLWIRVFPYFFASLFVLAVKDDKIGGYDILKKKKRIHF
jgi:hypothetical protein